jgi:hypothetical protein
MDLDNMIFLTGSNFTFGSWICEADDQGKLQGHLGNQKDQEDLTLSARSTEELTGRFSHLVMSESVQVSPMTRFNSDSKTESTSETNLGSFHDKPGSFSHGSLQFSFNPSGDQFKFTSEPFHEVTSFPNQT